MREEREEGREGGRRGGEEGIGSSYGTIREETDLANFNRSFVKFNASAYFSIHLCFSSCTSVLLNLYVQAVILPCFDLCP